MVVCNQSLMACGICIPPIFTSGKEDENNAIVKSNHRRVDRLALQRRPTIAVKYGCGSGGLLRRVRIPGSRDVMMSSLSGNSCFMRARAVTRISATSQSCGSSIATVPSGIIAKISERAFVQASVRANTTSTRSRHFRRNNSWRASPRRVSWASATNSSSH